MGGLTSVVRGAGIRAAMPWVIMMGRYVVGVGVGMSAVVVPQYVAELASTKRRGQLTAMFEFVLCFGMLASTLMNTVLSPLPGTHLPLSLSPYDRKEHLRPLHPPCTRAPTKPHPPCQHAARRMIQFYSKPKGYTPSFLQGEHRAGGRVHTPCRGSPQPGGATS